MPKGIVETTSKKEVKTKFGMKPTYSVKVDGEWYSNGFTDPRVSAGDEIAFEYTDGRYGKEFDKGTVMRISKGADEPTPAAAPAHAPKSAPATGFSRPFPIPPLHGDRAIIRQNALAHATRVYASVTTPGTIVVINETAENIIKLARKFEAYACGDLDAEAAKAKMVAAQVEEELS